MMRDILMPQKRHVTFGTVWAGLHAEAQVRNLEERAMETRPRAGLIVCAALLALAELLGGGALPRGETGLGSYARVVAAESAHPAASPQPGSDCLMLMVVSRQRARSRQEGGDKPDRDHVSAEAAAVWACAVGETPPCRLDGAL